MKPNNPSDLEKLVLKLEQLDLNLVDQFRNPGRFFNRIMAVRHEIVQVCLVKQDDDLDEIWLV